MEKAWFEMRAETRRRLAEAVWIPLKQWTEVKRGEYGALGYLAELEGIHSVAIDLDCREQGEAITWSSSDNAGVWASTDAYKGADVQWGDDNDEIGAVLVLEQSFDSAEPSVWHLNQDLVFALGLLREGDVWVRPAENYDEVVRLERNQKGRPASIKIRAEYLRDYLAARRMALRVSVHFGINEQGLVNAYAHDVARLDEWERRIWAAYNLAPDGGVSHELTAAQVKTEPANTKAPEAFLGPALEAVNRAFRARFGITLIKEHEEHENILQRTHRFRVTDQPSLLALAKDVARLTADSFDVAALRKLLSTPKDERLGSLKGIQHLLEPLIGEKARELMGPLVGIYDLRLGDAHLPSSDVKDALQLVQIDSDQPWINQGRDLLHIAVSVLYTVAVILRDGLIE